MTKEQRELLYLVATVLCELLDKAAKDDCDEGWRFRAMRTDIDYSHRVAWSEDRAHE